MPLIDNVKRLQVEDFPPEQQQLAERIAIIYNFFAEQVTNVLNGRVDFENLNRSLLELRVTVDSTGTPITNTRFSTNNGLKGINIIRADNLTNTTNYPNGAPFISFSPNGQGTYSIQNISNLPANNEFRLVMELIF